MEPIHSALRLKKISYPLPPSAEASRVEDMRNLWAEAGFRSIETKIITVKRAFDDFDDFSSKIVILGDVSLRSHNNVFVLHDCLELIESSQHWIKCSSTRLNFIKYFLCYIKLLMTLCSEHPTSRIPVSCDWCTVSVVALRLRYNLPRLARVHSSLTLWRSRQY